MAKIGIEINNYNDIGISNKFNYNRTRKLLLIGIIASVIHLIGNLIFGYGLENSEFVGINRILSAYTTSTDGSIFASSLY